MGSHSESEVAKSDRQQQRLLSLDAYRGLIMVSLAFKGFGLRETAENHLATNPDSSFWQTVHYQFSHVPWTGCGYWDLIQPSFMFMVGVSMAYSYAKRSGLGHSYGKMLRHALWRSAVLILLGIFLISDLLSSTSWSLMNVLTQIGLGYTFLFLFWRRRLRSQSLGAVFVLILTWMLYVLYPGAGVELPSGSLEVGVQPEWAQQHLAEVSPAWHKNANVGHAVDGWLLNQLPRQEPFVHNGGGYQSINFIPSLAHHAFRPDGGRVPALAPLGPNQAQNTSGSGDSWSDRRTDPRLDGCLSTCQADLDTLLGNLFDGLVLPDPGRTLRSN